MTNHEIQARLSQRGAEDAEAAPAGIEFLLVDFYQVDVHENFYAELKRYLRSMKG